MLLVAQVYPKFALLRLNSGPVNGLAASIKEPV